jgi:hypothetical protein
MVFVFCFSGVLVSCKKQKKMDKRITIWHLDKIAYGTTFAHENLRYIFPNATVYTGDKYPLLRSETETTDSAKTLIMIGWTFSPEPADMDALLRFASSGNQVFISAEYFEDTILSMLNCKIDHRFLDREDSMELEIYNSSRQEWLTYKYPGFADNNYFSRIDTGHSTILGKNANGYPNFIRLNYKNGGALFLHSAPLAFSNFFLLHGNNHSYYEYALSNLSEKTNEVEWSDYFRHYRTKPFSTLHFILSQRALRWAFWLLMFIFLILLVVESKRKQRPIAEFGVVRNASEDFVKTVGRLYFQQKNNQNLAAKMIFAFLENLRVTYNLSTAQLNAEFENKLAFRTGISYDQIRKIIHTIHELRLKQELTDRELMDLHQQINQFNKQT